MPQKWQKNKPGSRTEGGDGMAFATPEDIAQARSMDLLTYLKNYEPGELVKVSNGTYCTREHDSLKISNGMWYWFSRSIGGASALDYLIQVKGYSLPVAVETILGRAMSKPPVSYKQKDRTPKQLLLPERNSTNSNVIERAICIIKFVNIWKCRDRTCLISRKQPSSRTSCRLIHTRHTSHTKI